MSETSTLSPAKAKEQQQLKILAVLGVVLVLALVFFVLKPFSGDDTSSAPPAPVTTVATDASGTPLGSTAAPTETTAPAPPPARPARTPFDPPR